MRLRILERIRRAPFIIRLPLKLALAVVALTYFAIVRSFLFLLALYVTLYFLTGTEWFRGTMQGLVSDSIAGTMSCAAIQWGPAIDQVQVADYTMRGVDGLPVVRAPYVDAEVDLAATISGLARFRLNPGAPLVLHFNRAVIREPEVIIDRDETERIRLVRAVRAPGAEDRPPDYVGTKDNFDIRVAQVRIQGAHGRVELGALGFDVVGLDVQSDFNLTGDAELSFAAPRVQIASLDAFIPADRRPTADYGRVVMPITGMSVHHFRWKLGDNFEWLHASGALDGGRVVVKGKARVLPDTIAWDGSASLSVPETSPLLRDVTGDNASGGVDLHVRGRGTLDDVVVDLRVGSPEIEIAGFPIKNLYGQVDIRPATAPDGTSTHRYGLEALELGIFGGKVTLESGAYHTRWARSGAGGVVATGDDLDARLKVEGVNPWALLGSALFEPPLDVKSLPFLDGSLDGFLDLVVVSDAQSERLRLEARADDLSMVWAGGQSLPVDERYTLNGGISYLLSPPGVEADGTDLRYVERLELDGLKIKSGGDIVEARGEVDLRTGALDLRSTVRIGELATFLQPFGFTDLGGRLRLGVATIGGTLENPSVRGGVSLSGGTLYGEAIGDVDAEVDLDEGVLSFARLNAPDTRFGTVRGAGTLRLWRGSWRRPDPKMPFTLQRAQVRNLNLAKLLPEAGISGIVSVDARRAAGHLADPVGSLTGAASAEGEDLEFQGERVKSVSFEITATPGRVELDKVKLSVPGGRLTGRLGLDKDGGALSAQVKTQDLPFSSLAFLQRAGLDLGGRVGLDVQLGGSLSAPRLDGVVWLDEFGYDPVSLGSAQISLRSRDGKPGVVDISADRFFDRLELHPGGFVDLRGGQLRELNLTVSGTEVELQRIFPDLELGDFGVRGSPTAELSMSSVPGRPSFELVLTAAPRDLEVTLFDGEIVYSNRSPLEVDFGPKGLSAKPFELSRGDLEPLLLCGGFDARGRLDVRVGGHIDLAILEPVKSLKDVFSVLEGALMVGEDPKTAAGIKDRCLPTGDAVVHVTGEFSAPRFAGRLESSEILIVPRNFGQEILIHADGSGVVLAHGDKPGEQLLLIPESAKLVGEVDDGNLRIWGRVRLSDFALEEAELSLVGNDLYFTAPGEYSLTFNPSVRASVFDFGSDELRALVLTGDVVITEGAYYKSFDSLSSAFSGGESEAYEDPLTERFPWLKDLSMDINVNAPSFAIRSPFPLGKADVEARMDLAVTGTLDDPQVMNRIDILPGGIITYNVFGREFEMLPSTLDFLGDPGRPRVDITAQTEIEYLRSGSVDSREEHVTITVDISGTVPDELDVKLSSTPATYDQADLQSLLLTGKPLAEGAESRDDNLFSFDVGSFVDRLLKAPFDYSVFVGSTLDLGFDIELYTRFGRDFSLRTRATQESTDSTRLTAGFQFKLSDDILLEGTVDRTTATTTTATETYEAKLKYRIPLD